MSEALKYKSLYEKYCEGNGADVGSGGTPAMPRSIQVDLPSRDFARYNNGSEPLFPIQWEGTCFDLPFKDNTLDHLISAHLLEDFEHWSPALQEWTRVIKPGGYLVIIIPDKQRWAKAVENGQPPNCAHRHEGSPGELSAYATMLNLEVIEDRLTDMNEFDYSILFVGRKL